MAKSVTASKKHGVHIIEHKKWNTKIVYNNGLVMRKYLHQPKKLKFSSAMVNDENQNLCGGWFLNDVSYDSVNEKIFNRVLNKQKPFGSLIENLENASKLSGLQEKAMEHGLMTKLLTLVDKTELILCQNGKLDDLFDMDALCKDYIDNLVGVNVKVLLQEFSYYKNKQLIDFASIAPQNHGWDIGYNPMWVTGLLLGYPVENTISCYIENSDWWNTWGKKGNK